MLNDSHVLRLARRRNTFALHAAEILNKHPEPTLFRLLMMSVLIIAILCCVLTITVLTATRSLNAGHQADPFAPFRIYLPGQPPQKWMRESCQPDTRGRTHCDLPPVARQYVGLSLTLKDGIIQKVWIGTTTIEVADLVHHWGRPDVITRNVPFYTLKWHNGMVALARGHGAGWFNYRLPVESVFVTSEFR